MKKLSIKVPENSDYRLPFAVNDILYRCKHAYDLLYDSDGGLLINNDFPIDKLVEIIKNNLRLIIKEEDVLEGMVIVEEYELGNIM